MDAETRKLCPVCGETDPWPRDLCLVRLDPAARRQARESRRCSYSLEGDKRIAERLAGALNPGSDRDGR